MVVSRDSRRVYRGRVERDNLLMWQFMERLVGGSATERNNVEEMLEEIVTLRIQWPAIYSQMQEEWDAVEEELQTGSNAEHAEEFLEQVRLEIEKRKTIN